MGTSGNREPPVLTRAGHSFPALLQNPRRAAGAGQRMTGFLPASSQARTHSIFGHPRAELGAGPEGVPRPCPRKPSDGHHPHSCRARGRNARPPLRGAQRGPGGLPGKRSIRIPEAFVSARPALPRDRRAPGAPREPVPKPSDANGPGLGLPESLLSSHYPPPGTQNPEHSDPHPPPAPAKPTALKPQNSSGGAWPLAAGLFPLSSAELALQVQSRQVAPR